MQLVKTTPLKMSPLPPIPDTIKEVIYDMLNALAAYHAPEEGKPLTGTLSQFVFPRYLASYVLTSFTILNKVQGPSPRFLISSALGEGGESGCEE